jgi:hypothetical protein
VRDPLSKLKACSAACWSKGGEREHSPQKCAKTPYSRVTVISFAPISSHRPNTFLIMQSRRFVPLLVTRAEQYISALSIQNVSYFATGCVAPSYSYTVSVTSLFSAEPDNDDIYI